MKKTSKAAMGVANDNDRFVAAISYIWILCLYGLLFKKDSAFVQHHAKQGLALFVIEIIAPIFLFLMPVIWILCIIMAVMGFKASMEGKTWVMPVIGEWLKKSGV